MTDDHDPRAPWHPKVKTLYDMTFAARTAERVIEAEAMRAFDPATAAMFNIGAPEVPVEREIRIPGPAGEIRALLFACREWSGAAMPVVMHIHGGGFVIMSPETSAKVSKQFALGAHAIVVSIDYRRAPEDPYPAPLDDCLAAFRWLRANAPSLGGDASRIAIAGESAGGNLAAATALRLIAEGDAPPHAALLVCPWLDLEMMTPSFRTFGPADALIDDAVMTYWRDCYAPDAAQWDDPFVSPLRGDLRSFPPTCIVVGGIDPLCDEGVLFAERLRAAGRETELHEYAGMPHVFMFFPMLDSATDAVPRMQAFLRRSFGEDGAK